MVVVSYKLNKTGELVQVPFKTKAEAIIQADRFYNMGYLGVKVSEVEEEILYIPR